MSCGCFGGPRRATLALLALASGALSAGCGGPGTGNVSGRVLLANGKPLPGGTVTFFPVERGSDRNPVSATVKADGSYDAAAVPAGEVHISVSNASLDPRAGTPAFAAGPKGYMPGMPPLNKIGPPKGALKGAEMSPPALPKPEGTFVPLDPRYADPERSGLTYEVRPGDQKHDIEGIVALGPGKQ